MKKLLLAGLALTLMATTAFAQADAPPPPPPAGVDAAADQTPPPPPPPGPDGMREHRGPHGRDAGPPPPPPSKAAHFHLRRGDVEIDAKCADDEPMKACVESASQLIDKLAALPR